jgi:ATP-binding cassette subfamily F protein 3
MLAGLTNVTFEFGSRTLFRDATWHIQPGERNGLIGYNGTGKSTILKLLAGEYAPTSGVVEKSRNTSIGYLHQDLLSFDTNDSILNVALGAFGKVLKLEKEIEEMGKALENNPDDKMLQIYSDKLHEMETLDGYTIHHRTAEILQGLGFANSDLKRPYREFSGGWRMRVLLAKMILQQPDLLLLDEPTNHLDLPSIEWLEKYLQNYPGAVVIVSHDKYFLNRMVTKIVELYQQQLHFYSGNYEFYESEKQIRMDLQQKAFENQQDYIRQNERLIERFRAKASKAAMAQSLIKKLEKLDRLEEARMERPSIKINFRIDTRPGKTIVKIKKASKSFGQIKIIENTEAEVLRGDKIALIGANGKGKSTVLRILAGTEPFDGEKVGGHNVEQSFYAQHQLDALNIEHTVLQEMMLCGSQKTELELRTLLGCFLFSGDDIGKKIKVLSGGEKARVALAKTIISRANFLLLDEPTNHLDIHSVELMIEALNRYQGSYILVSHDRYFISKTANKIWEIEDYKIKEFLGGYEEYVEWKKNRESLVATIHVGKPADSAGTGSADDKYRHTGRERRHQVSKKSGVSSRLPGRVDGTDKSKKSDTTAPAPGIRPQTQAPINKEQKKELQKQQKIFQQLEEKITNLNQLKQELESALASPATYANKAKFIETESRYKNIEAELMLLNREYDNSFEKIMKLQQ